MWEFGGNYFEEDFNLDDWLLVGEGYFLGEGGETWGLFMW
jgi:hypothetical protein